MATALVNKKLADKARPKLKQTPRQCTKTQNRKKIPAFSLAVIKNGSLQNHKRSRENKQKTMLQLVTKIGFPNPQGEKRCIKNIPRKMPFKFMAFLHFAQLFILFYKNNETFLNIVRSCNSITKDVKRSIIISTTVLTPSHNLLHN